MSKWHHSRKDKKVLFNFLKRHQSAYTITNDWERERGIQQDFIQMKSFYVTVFAYDTEICVKK